MTDKQLTHLLMISDRSGSMMTHRDDTEGGINAFLDEHKKAAGECDLTFVQFDTSVEKIADGSLSSYGKYVLTPRGGTALLDAIGQSVTRLGEKLEKRPEAERPGQVIVVMSTDGQENSSREWRRDQVKELLERQQSQWQWQVIFLGANIDAIAEGASLGINRSHTMTYDQSNVTGTYNMAARSSLNYRAASMAGESYDMAMAASAFTDEDRETAMTGVKSPSASTSTGDRADEQDSSGN